MILRLISSVLLASTLVGCGGEGLQNREKGALGGAAIGAGLGAIIGSATGKAGYGTAIGGGIGALSGAVIGHEMDKSAARDREYDDRLTRNEAVIQENQRLLAQLRTRGVDVRVSDRGVVMNLPDVLFALDSADISPSARRDLEEIADILSEVEGRYISVEGHTDSTGTVGHNQQLSLRRANSVAQELTRNGVPRDRITTRGFGQSDPIASNATQEGRARNRRVEIIVENY